jgi:mannosyltransferase OCH1-like enzyme
MYSFTGHPFWRQLMIELEKIKDYPYYYGKHISVMFTTGPGILNRIYSRYKYKYKLKSLPWKLFHPFGIGDDKLKLRNNKEVFAIHLGNGSWEQKDSGFFLFCLTEWKMLVLILVFLILNILIK